MIGELSISVGGVFLSREEDEYEDEDPGLDPVASEESEWAPARRAGEGHRGSLALGFLAMVPLLFAYEYGLSADPTLARSHSELALFRALGVFGEHQSDVRHGVLLLGVVISILLCYRRRIALVPSLIGVFLEGVLGAILIGPALALGIRLFGGLPPEIVGAATPVAGDPGLPAAARILGGAAYEELLFRVLLYGGIYLVARRVALFFGASERVSPWLADLFAVVGSATAFAAVHLAQWNAWMGPGGEPFSAPVFCWRFLAGVLLALLFRWRGPGVAAWTHGLFNLALLLGAGPEIML